MKVADCNQWNPVKTNHGNETLQGIKYHEPTNFAERGKFVRSGEVSMIDHIDPEFPILRTSIWTTRLNGIIQEYTTRPSGAGFPFTAIGRLQRSFRLERFTQSYCLASTELFRLLQIR